jgi:hypothetical protein
MIDRRSVVLALAASATFAAAAEAQTLGIGGRVGTLGLGAEAAVALTDRFVVRGGLGVAPFEPSLTLGDIELGVEFPKWYNVGADLYLNGAVRVGAGLLFKGDGPRLTTDFTTDQDLGGQTFTAQEIGTLVAGIDSSDKVPYALIGFGKHTAPGVGLFVDFGVAFMGAPSFRLSTEGGTLADDTGPLRTALDAEAAEFDDDAGRYLEFWPILNIGLRIGLGGSRRFP